MADAAAKTQVGSQFRKQMLALQQYAAARQQQETNNAPGRWYRPEGFNGDLLDPETYHAPFSREEHEEEFDAAIANADEPGTTTDLAMLAIQGDTLHLMERAYRARHHTSVRTRVHPAGRHYGHGHANGPIVGGMLRFIESLDLANKGEQV